MIALAGAILPVFLTIALGHLFRRSGFLPETFWDGTNRLTFYVLVPALLISSMSRATLTEISLVPMLVAVIVPVLVVSFGLAAIRPKLTMSGPAFTSLFQGAVRPNAYIAFAVALDLFGEAGLSAIALALAPTVPLVNLLCIAVLARYGAAQADWRQVPRRVVRNPLILATAVGVLLQASGAGLPPILDELLAVAGRAALPIALLAVGAGLSLKAAKTAGKTVVGASILRLVAMPAATALVAAAMGLEGDGLFLAVLFNAVPAATVSYVMAQQLGGDAPLMAGIITVQTALSLVTLPLALIFFA